MFDYVRGAMTISETPSTNIIHKRLARVRKIENFYTQTLMMFAEERNEKLQWSGGVASLYLAAGNASLHCESYFQWRNTTATRLFFFASGSEET